MFNVNPEAKKLPEERAQLFHHLVASYFTYVEASNKTYQQQSHSYVLDAITINPKGNEVHMLHSRTDTDHRAE